MKNQECKIRPEIININRNEPVFYPFSIKTSKCNSSCNNINDLYAKICVPNAMSRTNKIIQNGMKHVSVNVDQMQVSVIITMME